MQVIEKIEIKSFRSFGNRKQTKTQINKIKDLNIFSGANDSGKSNILRALNLFFNKKTNLNEFLNFEKDFFRRENPDEQDVKQELITIKITFWNEKNKGINEKHKDYTRLPEKFWVSRKWLKTSEFSSYQQDDGIDISFKIEKKDNLDDFFEKDGKTLKRNIRANLSKQLTDFLDSIQYHYIPAIKDKEYFSHLYGELQQTLLKEANSEVNQNKVSFQSSIQETTKQLMNEFQNVINNNNVNINAVFELPNLINLFRTLNVQTNTVSLDYRGDGLQAKLIPEILNFIAVKELSIKPSKLVKGEKSKKYFIWGFEEPENSYEYKNAQLLADRFCNVFNENAQIFLTTHSFNFLSINGENVSTYRVWKDNDIESSKISKIRKDKSGVFQFENSDLKNDTERLNEELGIFQLNQDLELLYLETERTKKQFIEKIEKIQKPILYTEGNNIEYIKKAKEFLLPNLTFDIESLGSKSDIEKFFKRFYNSKFDRYKCIFVFDCDAKKEFNDCENIKTEYLIPYIFKENKNNTILSTGIENLFDDDYFKEPDGSLKLRFFPKVLIDKGDVSRNIESQDKKLNDGKNGTKTDFSNFICNERNNIEDFNNFKELFQTIESLFKEESDY